MSNPDAADNLPAHMNESPPLSAYEEEKGENGSTGYTYGIKVDSRTANCILLTFVEVVAETQKAICLAVLDHDTEQVIEDWFPKKLCSNMNTVKKTVHVWDVFMEEHKADLIPPEQRVNLRRCYEYK